MINKDLGILPPLSIKAIFIEKSDKCEYWVKKPRRGDILVEMSIKNS